MKYLRSIEIKKKNSAFTNIFFMIIQHESPSNLKFGNAAYRSNKEDILRENYANFNESVSFVTLFGSTSFTL